MKRKWKKAQFCGMFLQGKGRTFIWSRALWLAAIFSGAEGGLRGKSGNCHSG
ncbi:hypothetical protein B4135_3214 [Caldibacillus debilis]|jgi:hypothetical protein|uniref:Uncharacterized protein n=1 Tax=Caldibacillus debilis TaxID=301148 RepID=A0A150LH33_9BACI|nr:hypothetical protein B4135_3214 [Caldibacillus debilis]